MPNARFEVFIPALHTHRQSAFQAKGKKSIETSLECAKTVINVKLKLELSEVLKHYENEGSVMKSFQAWQTSR